MIIIFVIIVFISFYFLFIDDVESKIEEIKMKNSISIEKGQEEKLKEYDYYQVYVYPNDFSIECKSSKEDICNTLQTNLDSVKSYPLLFLGQRLRHGEASDMNLDIYFLDSEKNKQTVKDIFKLLYFGKGEKRKITGDEKYFDFKKTDTNTGVSLNEMEILCIEGIKNSIIPGTYDEENIIKERAKLECNGLSKIKLENIAFGGNKQLENDDTNIVNLSINISELMILYKFFKKESGNFKEVYKEGKKINKIFTLTSQIDLSEF
ncbi:hypothetical protein HGA92_02945 [Candidatus Gracilibacteria bacterium]|nr:hypothetical protein [Candidatus Gracilibacteria bacterium]NUJ98374.1 hypothetical protein [Candidatus Gracilibacteria bacterium]